jgi:hypothetical protein
MLSAGYIIRPHSRLGASEICSQNILNDKLKSKKCCMAHIVQLSIMPLNIYTLSKNVMTLSACMADSYHNV